MARLFTVTLPARAGGSDFDYDAHYEALKLLLRSNNPDVTLADRLVYEDDLLAGSETDILKEVDEVLTRLLKRVRELSVAFDRMTLKVTDLDEMKVGDDVDFQLVFPNKKPKTLSGSLRLKAAGGSNKKNRVKREVEIEEVVYDYDLQGLNPERQLENKILDITALGPDGARGGRETVEGVSVYHHTIPRSNLSFFYTWEGNTLKVYGIGRHSGKDGDNSQYDVNWHSGRSFTYRR